MSPVQTTIQCPGCGAPQQAVVEQIIDVGRDPGAKARLVQGRWNYFRCPACGFQGGLASPLIYHDPIHELLLTYIPPELRLNPMEQEQVLGRLTQQVVQSLPAELRKGYLLRPQAILTMQGLMERILEADGITREMLEEQRQMSLLVRDLMETDPAARPAFIAEHDARITADVLAMLGVLGRSASAQGDQALAEKILQTREDVLRLSTAGKRVQTQKEDFDQAARELEALGDPINLDALVQLVASAPSLDRVTALASLAWQGMDYTFFQHFTERVERASGSERERLIAIRERALEEIQRIQQAMQSEMNQAVGLLQSIVQAPDLDRAVEEYLPDLNDLFFAVLETNLESARRDQKEEAIKRLEEVKGKILAALEKALPAEVRFIRDLLQEKTDEAAERLLQSRTAEITDVLLEGLKTTAEDLKTQKREPLAERIEKLRVLAEKQRAMARFGVAK